MKDKGSITKAFNKHLFEFIDDILLIYPGNEEILYAKTSFESIKKLNVTAIIKAWYSHIYIPYSAQIDNGNIDYFIQKDYSADLVNLQNGGDIIKMIDNIRRPISTMDNNNKEYCVKYIQNLSKLSIAYNNM